MRFPIDHDMHCHTHLSLCSNDPQQSVASILSFAKAHGYTLQCITDHLWDSLVPGASGFYRPQDIEHVRQSLPLPKDDRVRMVFGCETEYCGGDRLALDPRSYEIRSFTEAFDVPVVDEDMFEDAEVPFDGLDDDLD